MVRGRRALTTRGFPDGVCTVTSTYGIDVSPERRARDAYAALAHLRAQPYVDGSRVGLMGGSHEAARRAGQPVTIKIYPGAHHSFDSDRPVRYVEARNNPSSPTGRGATTGGDPAAWADSIREVADFSVALPFVARSATRAPRPALHRS